MPRFIYRPNLINSFHSVVPKSSLCGSVNLHGNPLANSGMIVNYKKPLK